MIVSAICVCGNITPALFYEYDGCLGYEATVCVCCGRYTDHTGEHEPDDWSKRYVNQEGDQHAS
jgi:hypothetical protein